VCRLLADERVHVLAMMLEASGHLRLIVDNRVRAAGVLRARHHQVAERDVLVLSMENAAEGLASVLKLLADAGVNIDYAYGTLITVLGVDDPFRAATVAGA
jgi:hypothetical protein